MTTKKKTIKKEKRLCFLKYPDWKAWSAMAPELCHENYGEYVTNMFFEMLEDDTILATFNAKDFGEYIRKNNLDFEVKNMEKNRQDWIDSLPKKKLLKPFDSESPYKESPEATISLYGHVEKQIPYYMMVAIQWKSDVKESHQFVVQEFGDFEIMFEAVLLYTCGFGVKHIYSSSEVLEPCMCPCCGGVGFEVYHDDSWGEKKQINHHGDLDTPDNFEELED